ncbi:hypothetical protein LXL04_004056 [Taraxacum kok-saghyz]
MADVSRSSPEVVLFVAVLFLVPLFAHPLEFQARPLLDYSPPPTTTVTTSDLGFLAAAHEVPSGANPDSNRASFPFRRKKEFRNGKDALRNGKDALRNGKDALRNCIFTAKCLFSAK